MTRVSRKKKNQPPKTKDVFKLFRWYKKKWDRQAKEDERERRRRNASDKNHIRKLRAIDRRSAEAAQKHTIFFKSEQQKLRKLNNVLQRILGKK